MEVQYPPVDDDTRGLLERALFRLPERHREDAMQEMWLAHLEGRNPVNAIRNYSRDETAHEKRLSTSPNLDKKPATTPHI